MTHDSKNYVIPEVRHVESLTTGYYRAPTILAFAASDDDGAVLVYEGSFTRFFKEISRKFWKLLKELKNLDKDNNL